MNDHGYNLFLLKIGALDLQDPSTFGLVNLSQERFDALTSLHLIDFYKCCDNDYYPIKKMFAELVALSLDDEEMHALTDLPIRPFYCKKIASITEMADLYKRDPIKCADIMSTCSSSVNPDDVSCIEYLEDYRARREGQSKKPH